MWFRVLSRTPFTAELPLCCAIHFYKPRGGCRLPHNPFKAIVGPHPIGWISSQSKAGALNLAPCSFSNAIDYIPPITVPANKSQL